MKRIIFLVIFISAVVNPIFAAEWTRVASLPAAEFLKVYVNSGTLYAGGPGTVYFKNDCASDWGSSLPVNGNADNIAAMIKVGDRLFVGVWGEGVFESTDNGTIWTPRNSGLSGAPMDFAVRGDSLYVATDGEAVFVMNLNGAATWSTYRDGLAFGTQWNVQCLLNHDDVLIAGAGANGYISTRQRGQTEWQTHKFSEFAQQILSMLDLSAYDGKVYGVANDGLYVSGDSGKVWEQHLTNLGLVSTGGVCIDGDRVYAMACKPGLFTRIYQRIQDAWVIIEDIPGATSYGIAMQCNRIYLARADGLWYRDLDQTDVPGDGPVLPNAASLEQNFPNPFNPSTTIRFVVNKPAVVKVTVFNVLGQVVEVLLNEYCAIGTHRVEWDGVNADNTTMPAGIYFYRLQIDSYTETRKMVLLK